MLCIESDDGHIQSRINTFFAWRMHMKVPVVLLSLALGGAVFVAMPMVVPQASAQEKDAAADKAEKKETKWQGYVVRINKDQSTMDLRGGVPPSHDSRKVAYDSSTEWTKQGKPAEQDEFKNESFVILVGHLDHEGVLHATRIDLRRPR
jgi:hypothetical protein